jgi:hypothetical protein
MHFARLRACSPSWLRSAVRRLVIAGIFAGFLAVSGFARAQGQPRPGAPGTDTAASLEQELARSERQLSTAGISLNGPPGSPAAGPPRCVDACRALEAMRRAADRLCALDPGPPCKDARDRVLRATTRVHDTCPACAVAASGNAQQDDRDGEASTLTPSQPVPPPPPPAPGATEMRQESSPRKGGCASCASTGSALDDLRSSVVPVLAGLFVALRLRRRDPQTRRRGARPRQP